MKNPKFQIFEGSNSQFYFRLRAENGEPVLASEGYKSKSGATNGIDSVKSNAGSDANYERKTAVDDQFYFNLRAANQEIIGKSEMYKSESGRENGISVVKRIAGDSPTEDTTT